MLTQERYQSILSIINERNAVTVAELSQMLDTSESTIRRDLNALNELGKINKVFGGATAVAQAEGMIEDTVITREKLMSEEKTEIARYCATLINNTDFVYIDAGTTTSRLIDFIENDKATYVTNGIVHARKLIQKGLNAYMVGGKVKPVTEAVVGAEGINNLKNLNFSKAFMAFIIPLKAATHIIITMTQPPAAEKPFIKRSLSHAERSTVPASSPKSREETMPAPRHSSVWQPRKLRPMTRTSGITI